MLTKQNRPAKLRADCARCCGLCCVAPPFDAAQGFGFDKPAHSPCKHLEPNFSCSIHRERLALGFSGCVSFDCYGAGQRTTQQMFGGASWRESPDLAARMFTVYSRLRVFHELLSLLAAARERACSAPMTLKDIDTHVSRIDAMCNDDLCAFERIDVGVVHRDTMNFLRSLGSTLRQTAVTGFRSS